MSNVISFSTRELINFATIPKQQSGAACCIDMIGQRKNQVQDIIIIFTEINSAGVKICHSTMDNVTFYGMVMHAEDFVKDSMKLDIYEGEDE